MTVDGWQYDVTPDQIVAARALIDMVGTEYVSPRVREVASRPLEEITVAWAKMPVNELKVEAAQLLIELQGGEQFVEPRIVTMAHAKPAVSAAQS